MGGEGDAEWREVAGCSEMGGGRGGGQGVLFLGLWLRLRDFAV
jgi:hypothetical protein